MPTAASTRQNHLLICVCRKDISRNLEGVISARSLLHSFIHSFIIYNKKNCGCVAVNDREKDKSESEKAFKRETKQ